MLPKRIKESARGQGSYVLCHFCRRWFFDVINIPELTYFADGALELRGQVGLQVLAEVDEECKS